MDSQSLDSGQSFISKFGYEIFVHPTQLNHVSVKVRTIFSGPFEFPEGCVLVSTVYDIVMEKQKEDYATIKMEHCVDVSDPLVVKKMCFATATVDFERKVFKFSPVRDGNFDTADSTTGLLKIYKNCLLCVIYNGSR